MSMRKICSQCGEAWKEPACGPGHAAIAAELERARWRFSEAGEIAAARELFEYDRRYMDTECKSWEEIVARGYDAGYRDCAIMMLRAYADAVPGSVP